MFGLTCSKFQSGEIDRSEGRPIAPAFYCPSRTGGSDVRRSRQNNFPIIGRDQLDPRAASVEVAVVVLAVSLSAVSVLLVIDVPAKLLFEPGCDRDKRCHPVRLRRLTGRNHIEPRLPGALNHPVEAIRGEWSAAPIRLGLSLMPIIAKEKSLKQRRRPIRGTSLLGSDGAGETCRQCFAATGEPGDSASGHPRDFGRSPG